MIFLKYFLIYLDAISPLIAIIIFLVCKKVLKEKSVFYIFCYISIQLLCNGTADILYYISKTYNLSLNSHLLFHLNCIFSLYFILKFFGEVNQLKYRSHVFFLFAVFYLLYIMIKTSPFEFNSLGFSLASLIIIIYSFNYYFLLVRTPDEINIFYTSGFWFTTGIFTYYVCSFIIFITYEYLSKKGVAVGYLWRFHNILVAILCFNLSKGVLCKRRGMT